MLTWRGGRLAEVRRSAYRCGRYAHPPIAPSGVCTPSVAHTGSASRPHRYAELQAESAGTAR